MEIRLTDEGRKLLNKAIDVHVVNVSTKRAFQMMLDGYAVKDESFIKRYIQNEDNLEDVDPKELSKLLKKEKTEPTQEPKEEPKPGKKAVKKTSKASKKKKR